MTHRERIKAALSRQVPDRVPVDLGSTTATSITETAYARLREWIGLAPENPVFMSKSNRIVTPGEDVLRRYDVDTRSLMPGPPDNWEDIPLPGDSYEDEWHVVRRRPEGGIYYDLVGAPLASAVSVADLEAFEWPDPLDPGRFRGVEARARALHFDTDYAVVAYLPGWVVLQSQQLRGFDNFLADLIMDPDFACALMDRVLEYSLVLGEKFLSLVGRYADVVYVSDDVCIQTGPMMSPETYRKLIKPRHRRLIEFIKERTDGKILFHCCGSVVSLLDDLIEIGIDAINPVQVAAEGMGDTAALKEQFGDRVVFWGAIDTQHVLPHGTLQDVSLEVERRIMDLAPGGGYIAAAVHNIQPDVPPENIEAMFSRLASFGHRPFDRSPDRNTQKD
jgi:uroporphyrinogen decarboxylase